ncbi:hypothetical protein WN51_04132 [Melipona quadrifasciata]|uniref:Uncharacterized protein n=1 Tax=Melipona quadrifasciata TaxID=166423 RepID=A0A0M8ZRS9_9HYME|nr:hypothetical protein WN51_04132 [Melipona quadrifasciata]
MIDVIYKGGQNVEQRLLRVFEKDRPQKKKQYHTEIGADRNFSCNAYRSLSTGNASS